MSREWPPEEDLDLEHRETIPSRIMEELYSLRTSFFRAAAEYSRAPSQDTAQSLTEATALLTSSFAKAVAAVLELDTTNIEKNKILLTMQFQEDAARTEQFNKIAGEMICLPTQSVDVEEVTEENSPDLEDTDYDLWLSGVMENFGDNLLVDLNTFSVHVSSRQNQKTKTPNFIKRLADNPKGVAVVAIGGLVLGVYLGKTLRGKRSRLTAAEEKL